MDRRQALGLLAAAGPLSALAQDLTPERPLPFHLRSRQRYQGDASLAMRFHEAGHTGMDGRLIRNISGPLAAISRRAAWPGRGARRAGRGQLSRMKPGQAEA